MATDPCCEGKLHPGKPTGSEETLYDLPTYIANPPDGAQPRALIVILPDAFGWRLPNNRLLADRYSERLPVRTLLPELMDGNHLDWGYMSSLEVFTDKSAGLARRFVPALKAVTGMAPFLYRNRPAIVNPRIIHLLTSLREDHPDLPIGVAGFCWGGKFVFTFSYGKDKDSSGRPLIDAGFAAHPSNLSLPGDAEAITIPCSVAIGENDVVCGPEGAKVIEGAFQKRGGKEKGFEVTVIDGAKHGFGCRGDPEDEEAKKHYQQSLDQAVTFFDKWLLKKT